MKANPLTDDVKITVLKPDANPSSHQQEVGGRYESWAEWPGIHHTAPNERSCDTHDTQEQAEAVCKMLERDGLGGERKVFPIRTWVKPSNGKVSDGAN